ncbi:MAG TPA: hypothetical protein VG499_04860 [Actinomycetota bacterium]|nr:hypothetical protein [Actinomycetota bacterium]
MALFFAGMSTKLQSPVPRKSLLTLGCLLFLAPCRGSRPSR